jgi:hypothetical protein
VGVNELDQQKCIEKEGTTKEDIKLESKSIRDG